ncbi:MAG: hypothetical protein KKA44_15565 [Alphaproteobacteria bacterium]|nr:hypothetical protein [Alphaproteobacteria bacterium]MBU0866010.1 hypothetical protein [Alphaproteobacteria bacterium]MBU1826374.1 hypothetical protein [Alphaproteobacteria bacterium]
MVDDEIEFEAPVFTSCACCGNRSTHLVRFVTRRGNAFAVYYADFADGHDMVSLIASVGDWSEDLGAASRRTAFAMRLWVDGDRYQVGLVDAAESGYSDGFLGHILDRNEALAHPLRQEAFDLSDHAVACDRPVIEFLDNQPRGG